MLFQINIDDATATNTLVIKEKNLLLHGFIGNANEILLLLLFSCSNHSSMTSGCFVPIDAGENKGLSNLIECN